MSLENPRSKLSGVARFDGRGRNQAKPGTVKWYQQNMPERFNNTKIAIRNTSDCDEATAATIAARVLRWNEGPQQHINDSLMKEEQRLFNKELLRSRYFTEQNDLEPPKGF